MAVTDPTVSTTTQPANVAAATDPAATLPIPTPTTAPDSSGNLFQGSALPATTTTTQTQVTAPDFYTNYLQDIANLGQNAVTQGGVAGFSPLQQQAFQMAPQAAFSGAETSANAADLMKQAGTTSAANVVNQYLNPYMKNVVDEMGRLQQQNIQRNVMPALAAAGVGSGGFGSKRQLSATGQTLADMQANLTGQQYGALNTGYNQAMQAAQTDLSRVLGAGQGLGNLAQQQYQIGTGGLNELSTLGAIQQAQGQKMLDYPMSQAQAFSKLLGGYQIPTGSTQQTVAPGQQGQFTNSPLSQIAGLGTLLASLFPQQNPLQQAQANYYNSLAAQSGTQNNAANAANANAAALNAANLLKTNLGLYNMAVGPNNTFTSTANPGVSYTYDPNAAVGTNPFLQVPAANAPLVKDGGSIRKYAAGGTVDPALTVTDPTLAIDPTVMPIDYTLGAPQPGMVYATGFDPLTTTPIPVDVGVPTVFDPNNPPVMYSGVPINNMVSGMPTGVGNIDTAFGQTGFPAPGTDLYNQLANPPGQVFAGGTPYFNEATGTTATPRSYYERTVQETPHVEEQRRPGYDQRGNFIGMGNDVRTTVAPGVLDKTKLTPHQEMLKTAREAKQVADEYRKQTQGVNRGRR